ncbi:MAG TPA: cytochrome c oxidase subunit II [Sphingobacteriaceae bacterium]|nr:cytochrome c oxidase subunit II [Sphingobacteriaceae bacterium]
MQDDMQDRGRAQGFGILLALWAVVIGGVAFSIYAGQRWWMPELAAAHGERVDAVFRILLTLMAIVFVLVQAALGFFAWQSGRREKAIHWHDNPRLEITWTVIPAVVLLGMTIFAGVVWAEMHAPVPDDALTVEVTAEQFAWRIRYPGPDGAFGRTDPGLISRDNPVGVVPEDPNGLDDVVLLNELRLPVDRPVRILLRSKEVLHSFFVPEFRIKQDAVPGRTIEVTFQPTRVGDMEIACAELCGVGHFAMRGDLKVMPQDEFDQWLADLYAGEADGESGEAAGEAVEAGESGESAGE